MNEYELKQQRRREGLESAADAADARSDQAYQASRAATSGIVMGQPILVGHHSERRHRGALVRSDNAMRRSVEASQHAEELRRRADAVGTGGISSDDPDALDKLREKLAELQADQESMKAINKAIRSGKTQEAKVAALVKLGHSEAAAVEALKPDFAGRVGAPAYRLSNNNANIKRVQDRIKTLEAVQTLKPVEIEGDGYTYREDTEENRVMFLFQGKPDASVRDVLKSQGFKWSPSRGAWVRMLNGNGQWASQQVRLRLASIK